jgi:hypothetical protein
MKPLSLQVLEVFGRLAPPLIRCVVVVVVAVDVSVVSGSACMHCTNLTTVSHLMHAPVQEHCPCEHGHMCKQLRCTLHLSHYGAELAIAHSTA